MVIYDQSFVFSFDIIGIFAMLFLKLKKDVRGRVVDSFGKEGGSSHWEGAQVGIWVTEIFSFISQGNGFTCVCFVIFH